MKASLLPALIDLLLSEPDSELYVMLLLLFACYCCYFIGLDVF